MSNNQRAREAMQFVRSGIIYSRTTAFSVFKTISRPSSDETEKSYRFWRESPVKDAQIGNLNFILS